MNQRVENKFIIVLILSMLFMAQSSLDLYLPSFPSMKAYFNVSSAYIQASLTVFLISYAFSQVMYGPLSDQYGRKIILIIGALIFIGGSLVCATAHNIGVFLLGRCIQGAGIGSANVLSRIVLRDVYSGPELLKKASLLTMTWALSPIIAPVIGAYLQTGFGWRSNFTYMAVTGAIFMLSMYFFLPETLEKAKRRRLDLKEIKTIYFSFAKNIKFLNGSIGAAIIFSAMLAINSLSPFIYHQVFYFSSIQFGWITFAFCSGFLLGSINAPKIAKRVSLSNMALYGFIAVLLLFIINLFFMQNAYAFTAMLFVVTFLSGVISPQCVANSMSSVSSNIGFAGALFGFIVFTIGFMVTTLIAKIGTPSVILLISLLVGQIFLLFVWLKKITRQQDKKIDEISPQVR